MRRSIRPCSDDSARLHPTAPAPFDSVRLHGARRRLGDDEGSWLPTRPTSLPKKGGERRQCVLPAAAAPGLRPVGGRGAMMRCESSASPPHRKEYFDDVGTVPRVRRGRHAPFRGVRAVFVVFMGFVGFMGFTGTKGSDGPHVLFCGSLHGNVSDGKLWEPRYPQKICRWRDEGNAPYTGWALVPVRCDLTAGRSELDLSGWRERCRHFGPGGAKSISQA
eukprot:gene11309-biopygen10897